MRIERRQVRLVRRKHNNSLDPSKDSPMILGISLPVSRTYGHAPSLGWSYAP